MKWQ